MAREKVMSVAMRYADGVVLAADTIVALDDLVLGKPTDAADGWRILRMLSGRSHRVVTAYAIAHKGSIAETAAVTSSVKFRRLDDEEIERYLATEEPYDKAGAYGIQGVGSGFISAVEGDRSNVMGLPVNEVVAALARYGIYPAPHSDG
jgi:septum formation protein